MSGDTGPGHTGKQKEIRARQESKACGLGWGWTHCWAGSEALDTEQEPHRAGREALAGEGEALARETSATTEKERTPALNLQGLSKEKSSLHGSTTT